MIKKEANDHGKLFAALSAEDVSNLISTSKYKVEPSQVEMDKHIKTIGVHEVVIRLEGNDKIVLKINIQKK